MVQFLPKLSFLLRSAIIRSALIVLTLAAATVSAENVIIDGLSFPVDELSSVDAQTSKVTVNGVTRLLTKSATDDFIVETSLKNTKFLSNTSASSLAQFFLASLKGGHKARAKAALNGIVFLKDAAAVKAIVAALDRPLGDGAERIERGTIEAFKGVLVESDAAGISHEIAAELLLALGIRDPAWIKTAGSRFAIQHSEAFKATTDRTIEDLVEKRNFEGALKVIGLLEVGLGERDPVAVSYSVLRKKLSESLIPGKLGEVEELVSLLNLQGIDTKVQYALSRFVVESLHKEADRAIKAGEFTIALLTLSHVDLTHRTPTTHELVKKSLEGFSTQAAPAFFAKDVEMMLKVIADRDPSVKERYIALLERRITGDLEADKLARAAIVFDTLVAINPDPNQINDEVRVKLARAYLKLGEWKNAKQQIAAVRTGLGIGDRVALLFSGYYIGLFWIFVAIFSPIAAGIVFVGLPRFRILKDILNAAQRDRQNEEEHESSSTAQTGKVGWGSPKFGSRPQREVFDDSEPESEPLRQPFVNSKIRFDSSPRHQEYYRLVKQFGLTGNPTLQQIKNTYRQAVKAAHPDKSQDTQALASEKFIELTASYEKLLELRTQLGLPDE